jgi:hypothetical protein
MNGVLSFGKEPLFWPDNIKNNKKLLDMFILKFFNNSIIDNRDTFKLKNFEKSGQKLPDFIVKSFGFKYILSNMNWLMGSNLLYTHQDFIDPLLQKNVIEEINKSC